MGTEWSWHAEGGCWRDERCRIDRRHPDSGLVYLEQVGHKGIEVDVGVGEIVEGELLPVPGKH